MQNHNEPYDDLLLEGDADGAQVVSDLQSLYQQQPPEMTLPSVNSPFAERGRTRIQGWRRALAAAAAIAVVGVAGLVWNLSRSADEVSAMSILERAAVSSQGSAVSAPHRLVAAWGNGKSPDRILEVWRGAPDQLYYRTLSQGVDYGGQARDGNDVWLFERWDGAFVVAHSPQPPAPGSSFTLGPPFGPASTLSELIAKLRANGCGDAGVARLEDATFLGRPVFVLAIGRDTACTSKPGASGDNPAVTVWVDEATFVPLQIESETGMYYRVTEFEVGQHALRSSFRYEPPAGAKVFEIASLDELDTLEGWPYN